MGAEFVSRLDAGDLRGAATWLVHQHGGEVLGLCQAMVRDHAAAEDLAQDTFSRAFAGLANYRGEASPRSWLLTIAKNRCIDHLRREQARPWLLEDDPEHGESVQVDDAPLAADLASSRELVEAGMRVLDEQQRALVVLRFQHGMEYSELAHAFGVKAGTIRMRVSRALAKMRSAIVLPELELDGARSGGAPPAPQAAPAGSLGAPAPASKASKSRGGGGLFGGIGGKRRKKAVAAPAAAPRRPRPASAPALPPTFAQTLRSLARPIPAALSGRLDELLAGLPTAPRPQ